MGEPTTLIVDFNRLDDDDVLWVPRPASPRIVAGQAVILRDREGNQCLGYALTVDDKRITARAELGTWIDSEPVSVISASTRLDEVLAQRARLVKRMKAPTEPSNPH